jgi:hypothetical protein
MARKYASGKTVRFKDFHLGISSVNFEMSKTHLDEFVRQISSISDNWTKFTVTLTRTKERGLPDRIQISGHSWVPRRTADGKMGYLDRLCGHMSPEKTVFKLRPTPAPSLTAVLDARPEVSPAPNRYADPVSLIRGPCMSEMRSVSQLGNSPAAQATPRPMVRRPQPDPDLDDGERAAMGITAADERHRPSAVRRR